MMCSNIVIVVSRTHWCCVTCKIYCNRLESIDRHLLIQHPVSKNAKKAEFQSMAQAEKFSYSDGELETCYSHNQYKWHLDMLSYKMGDEQSLETNGLFTPTYLKNSFDTDIKNRRRNCRKQSKKTIKRQTRGDIHEDVSTVLNSPKYQTDQKKLNTTQGDYSCKNNSTDTNLKSKISLRVSTSCKRTPLDSNVDRKGFEASLPKKKNVLFSMPSNQASLQRKGTDNLKPVDLSASIRTSKVIHVSSVQDHVTMDKRDNTRKVNGRAKIGAFKKYSKVPSYTKRSKSEVDKSKIATCCAPWLFDAGRKAGEKVKKKQRRLMIPEEKDAVRELYGIPLSGQMATDHSLCGAAEGHSINAKSQMVIAPAIPLDADTNGRNTLTSILSPSSHNFFIDISRPQDSACSVNSNSHQQQQNHHNETQTSGISSTLNAPQTADSIGYPCFKQGMNSRFCRKTDLARKTVDGSSEQHSVSGNLPQQPDLPSHVKIQPNIPQNPVSTSSSCFEENNSSCLENGRKNMVDENNDNMCTICQRKFLSACEMHQHLQEMSRFSVVICKLCRHKFHGIHELNLHIFSEHELSKQVFCFICNENAMGLEDLEKHVHKHAFNDNHKLADTKFHDCRICKEELESSYTVVRIHYYQHHISHVCCQCFLHFTDLMSYTEHCRVHEGKPVMCTICGKEFVAPEELSSHFPCAEDVWAEDGKGAQCSKCGLWCPNRAVVEAHRKQHRSEDDVEAYRKGAQQGFPCVLCEKVFKNKHACRRHIKMVHEGVTCYKHYCEYCGKGFLTKNHMRDHIALHHLGIKRYKCEYCDQHFVCAPTLRRHVRKEHTKHKPYTCEHCGERFFEKTPLQRHLTIHTGLAPFMCEQCGKGFYTKHSFTNHGTIHTTTRDFICSGCHKGFTRKYNLQAHMKICKLV